jgi:hypothetical protein
MNFNKGLVLALLSFLLFLSITIFGFAFTLKNTVLSPDFIAAQLDKFDTTSLAGEMIQDQTRRQELPEELGTTLVNTITKLDPLVKEQVGAATHSVYDYLLGETPSLDLALILNDTVLSSDLIASAVNEFDIAPLMGNFLREKVKENVPQELEGLMAEYLGDIIDNIIIDRKPWLEEQIIAASDPAVAYLLGRSPSFSYEIPLDQVKASLRENVWQIISESPPPLLSVIPADLLEPFFNLLWADFAQKLPSTYELSESLFGTEIRIQITGALSQAEEALEQTREYVGYLQLGYQVLIGFMILLILGIILINRQLRGITRDLGTIFVAYGAFEYGGILAGRYFGLPQLEQMPMPTQLQSWLPQVVNDFLSPLEMFSLGLLIGGVVLLVISFIVKPKEA